MPKALVSIPIKQYKRGKHVPDFLMVSKIAQALDLPTAYFYTDDDVLAEIIQQYHALDNEKKQKLLEFIYQLHHTNDN
ncbi:hypothetical protein [Acinetobacter puyangensis]|uniref:hypothetical protein n=1 Tax=Acinetobacter puyangensis TaxID=1096779 RepID=UPI003A4E5FC5